MRAHNINNRNILYIYIFVYTYRKHSSRNYPALDIFVSDSS